MVEAMRLSIKVRQHLISGILIDTNWYQLVLKSIDRVHNYVIDENDDRSLMFIQQCSSYIRMDSFMDIRMMEREVVN